MRPSSGWQSTCPLVARSLCGRGPRGAAPESRCHSPCLGSAAGRGDAPFLTHVPVTVTAAKSTVLTSTVAVEIWVAGCSHVQVCFVSWGKGVGGIDTRGSVLSGSLFPIRILQFSPPPTSFPAANPPPPPRHTHWPGQHRQDHVPTFLGHEPWDHPGHPSVPPTFRRQQVLWLRFQGGSSTPTMRVTASSHALGRSLLSHLARCRDSRMGLSGPPARACSPFSRERAARGLPCPSSPTPSTPLPPVTFCPGHPHRLRQRPPPQTPAALGIPHLLCSPHGTGGQLTGCARVSGLSCLSGVDPVPWGFPALVPCPSRPPVLDVRRARGTC